MTAPVRLTTSSILAHIAQLSGMGVHVDTGLGLHGNRTTLRVTVRGDSYPCRDALKRWGFVWSQRYRKWTAFGDLDLASLLPELIAAHEKHERASEVERADVTYAGALGLLTAVRQ